MFPSLHTSMGEFGGKSWIALVLGPFHVFNASAIWRSARSLCTSAIAFLIAFAHCVTDGDGASDSTIHGYALNTRSVGTSPSGPTVSLMALNVICSAMSLLMSGISMMMIWYAHWI